MNVINLFFIKLACAFLVFSVPVVLQSQSELPRIYGILSDIEQNAPIQNVQVYLAETQHGDVTDESGYFELRDVPVGTQMLQIQMIGFQSRSIEITDLQRGEHRELFIDLQPKPYEIHELQVTANRHEVENRNIPQLVSTISALDFRERHITQTPEALREVVGVFVQNTNQGGGSPVIRGLRSNKLLLLVNGIRMNNAVYRGGSVPLHGLKSCRGLRENRAGCLQKINWTCGYFGVGHRDGQR